MASGQDDSIVTVVTCEGNISDPDFPYRLSCLVARLRKLLTSEKPFRITNVEPWNSVRVTFNIPREAAQRLRQLAQAGDRVLRDLGILSVQIEGDQVISLTIAGHYNEPQEILLQTTEDERTRPSSSVSGFAVAGGPDTGSSSSHTDATRKTIAQYLGQQGGPCSATLVTAAATASSTGQDSLFHGPRSPPADFKSPNVVAPGSDPIPFPPKTNPVPTSRTPNAYGPFPFASMTHAMNTMHGSHHSSGASTSPGSSPGRFPFSPPPPYPSGGGAPHAGAFQPVRHSSSFSPHHTSNSATATLTSPTSTVNHLPRGAADRANAALTSPLLVNLLQSDSSSTSQLSVVSKAFPPPPPSEAAVASKRRRKPRKSKEKTPTGSTATSPSASPLASPSDSVSHSPFPQPFGITLPTVPSIPLSPSLTPPSASPPPLVGQPFTSVDLLPHSRPVAIGHPLPRVPPLPSPPPTAPPSSASTSNTSGQSSQEADHELSPWPSPSKRTQHLINPFTGQLEPMSSEEDEDDTADRRSIVGPDATTENSSNGGGVSSRSNPFSEIGKDHDGRTGSDATRIEAKTKEAPASSSSPSLTPSSPSPVSSTSVVPVAPSGGSPSEKIKLRLKLEPKLRIDKDKESGRTGEKLKSEGGMTPLLQYKVDVSFVNIPSRRPGSAGCSSMVSPAPSAAVAAASSSSSAPTTATLTGGSATSASGAGPSAVPLEPRVPPLHISLRGRNAAVVTNPRREDRDKGRLQVTKECSEPPTAEPSPAAKAQRSRSPRGTRTDNARGNLGPAPSAGRRASISRGGGHRGRGRAASASMAATGPRTPASVVIQSSPPQEHQSPSPPVGSQSSVGREKTLLSGGSLVVEPGSPMASAAAVVANVPLPRLDAERRPQEETERPIVASAPLRASHPMDAVPARGAEPPPPPPRKSLELDRPTDPSSGERGQRLVTMQQPPPHVFCGVTSNSSVAASNRVALRTAQGRNGSSELNALLDIPVTPMTVPLTRRSSRDTTKNEDILASVVVRGVKVTNLSMPEATGRSSSTQATAPPPLSTTSASTPVRALLPPVHDAALQRTGVLDDRLLTKPEISSSKSVDITPKEASASKSESAPTRRRSLGSSTVSDLALRTRSHSANGSQSLSEEVAIPKRTTSMPESPSPVLSRAALTTPSSEVHRTASPLCRVSTNATVLGENGPTEMVTKTPNVARRDEDAPSVSDSSERFASVSPPVVAESASLSFASGTDGENARGSDGELSSGLEACRPRTVGALTVTDPLLNEEQRTEEREPASVCRDDARLVVETSLEREESAAEGVATGPLPVSDDVPEVFVERHVQRVPRSSLSEASPHPVETDVPSIEAASSPSAIPRIPRSSKLSALALSAGLGAADLSRLIPLRGGGGPGVLVDGVMRVVPVDSLPEEEVDGEAEFVPADNVPRHRLHHLHRVSSASARTSSVAIVALSSSSPCSASPSGSSPDSLNIGTGSEDNGDQGVHRTQRDPTSRQPPQPRNHCNSSGSPYEDSGIDSMDAIMEKMSGEDSPPGEKLEESPTVHGHPGPVPSHPARDEGGGDTIEPPPHTSPAANDAKEPPNAVSVGLLELENDGNRRDTTSSPPPPPAPSLVADLEHSETDTRDPNETSETVLQNERPPQSTGEETKALEPLDEREEDVPTRATEPPSDFSSLSAVEDGHDGTETMRSSSPAAESIDRQSHRIESAAAEEIVPPSNEASSNSEGLSSTHPRLEAPAVLLELCATLPAEPTSTLAVNRDDAASSPEKTAFIEAPDSECDAAEGLLVFHDGAGTDEDTDLLRDDPSETTQLLVFTVQDVDSIMMAGNCNDEMSLLQVNADDGNVEGTGSATLEFSTLTPPEELDPKDATRATPKEASFAVDGQHPVENSVENGENVPVVEVQLSPLVPGGRTVDSCTTTTEEEEVNEQRQRLTVEDVLQEPPTAIPQPRVEAPSALSDQETRLCADGPDVQFSTASVPNHVSRVSRHSLTTFQSVCHGAASSTSNCDAGAIVATNSALAPSRQVTLPIKFVTLPPGVGSPLLASCGVVAENGSVALTHSLPSPSGLQSASPVKVVLSHVGPGNTSSTVAFTTMVVESPVSGAPLERASVSATSTVNVGGYPKVSTGVSPSLVRATAIQVPAVIPIAAFSPSGPSAPLLTSPILRPVELAVTESVSVAPSAGTMDAPRPALYALSQPSTALDSSGGDSEAGSVVPMMTVTSSSWRDRSVSGATGSRSPDCKAPIYASHPLPLEPPPVGDGAVPSSPTPSTRPETPSSPPVCIREGKQDSMGSEPDTDCSTGSASSPVDHRRRSNSGHEDSNLSKDEADDPYTVDLSVTSGDHNYIFRASRTTTREKERDRLQRAERSGASEVEATTNGGAGLDPLTVDIPSEGETVDVERRSTRHTRSNSRLASPTGGRHSAASLQLSPVVNSCTMSPTPTAGQTTSDTEAEVRAPSARAAAKRRRDDSEDSDPERRKADRDDVPASPVASSPIVKGADGSKSPIGTSLNAHVYSKPVKRKCSENAVELIKACIGVDDNPKRVTGGKQQPTTVVEASGRAMGGKNAKTREDGGNGKPKVRPSASTGDASEESSDDEVTLSELVTKARSSKLKQMEDRSVTRNSKQKQNTKEDEGLGATKADRVHARANSRREDGRGGRGAGTPKESRKEDRTVTRVGGRLSDRGKRALSPARGQERSPQRANHRSRTRDQERATSPHNPKEESEGGKRKLRSSGASGYYDSLPQKRRRLSRDNR